MNFYETLAPYYDSFFPPNPTILDFIRRMGIEGPMRAYDAGCATGSLTLDLAAAGWTALGVDLCAPMIDIARRKALVLGAKNVRFECGDMTDGGFVDTAGTLGLALCLGNTLPHLGHAEIASFMRTLKSGLATGGLLVIQTLNYAHPDIKEGFVFPELVSGQAVFRRRYVAGSAGKLVFETDIEIEGIVHRDRTELTPIGPRRDRA